MNKTISTRQLIIFYCIYSFSIKFLSLPSLLSATAGKDAWISALVGVVIELGFLFLALLWLKNCDKSIYESLILKKNKVTHTASILIAKIILATFLGIFFYQILILTEQTYNLLNDNLFDYVPPMIFSIPLLLLGIFFCFMPSRSIFRSGEVFFVFIIFGIILSVFPALSSINSGEVTPIFEHGAKPIFLAVGKNIIYFESVLFLLMFKGEINISKHFLKKFMSWAVILAAFFVFFVFMFYSLFGPLAPTKNIAVTNFTIHSAFITTSGRLDWILISMWLLLVALRFGVTFFCAFKCMKFLTAEVSAKFQKYNGVITLVLSLVLTVAVYCIYSFVGVPYA